MQELADLSERGGVISSYLGLTDYNQKAINRSWKRFIAHQFHDDIPAQAAKGYISVLGMIMPFQ